MERIFYLCLSILSANQQILATHFLIHPSIPYYENDDIIQIQDNLNQDSDTSTPQNTKHVKNESQIHNIENFLKNVNNYARISSRQNSIQNSIEGEANSGEESARNIKDEYSGISNRNDLKDSFKTRSTAKALTKRSCDTHHRQNRKGKSSNNFFELTIESEDYSDENESAEQPPCDSNKANKHTSSKRHRRRRKKKKKQIECLCSKIYWPVCASDGHTYGNECSFDCQNRHLQTRGLKKIKLLFKGECGSLDKGF